MRLLSFHKQIQIILVQSVPEDYVSSVLDFFQIYRLLVCYFKAERSEKPLGSSVDDLLCPQLTSRDKPYFDRTRILGPPIADFKASRNIVREISRGKTHIFHCTTS